MKFSPFTAELPLSPLPCHSLQWMTCNSQIRESKVKVTGGLTGGIMFQSRSVMLFLIGLDDYYIIIILKLEILADSALCINQTSGESTENYLKDVCVASEPWSGIFPDWNSRWNVCEFHFCNCLGLVFIHRCCLQDRESFLRQLEDTENWLYEDGECEAKQVYTDRLAALKVWSHWTASKFSRFWAI